MGGFPSPSDADARLGTWEVLDRAFVLSTRFLSLAAVATGLLLATSIAFSAPWWRAVVPCAGTAMLLLGLAYLLVGEVRLAAARRVLLAGPSVYVSIAILSSLAGRGDGAAQAGDLAAEGVPADCDLQVEAALAWDRQLSRFETLRPKLLCLVEVCAGALAANAPVESPDMGLVLLFAAVGLASLVAFVAAERRETLLRARLADALFSDCACNDDAVWKG